MDRGRLLDVLDSAYDLDVSDDAWQRQVVERVQHAFDDADGVLSFKYRLDGGQPQLTSGVVGDPRFLAVPDEGHQSVDPRSIFRAYTAPSHAEPTTLFHTNPVTGEPPQDLMRMWARHEVRDMFGIYATRAGADSMTIGIALPRSTTPEIRACDWEARNRSWGAVSRHLENALNVRDALARGVAAEFDLQGRGDFDGRAAGARAQLVEAARCLEHHREQSDRGDVRALDVWSQLLRGRWSIVRHQRQGGRMRYLAIENPLGDTLRGLNDLERQVVARAARGESNKLMAIELELHLSTVNNLLASALQKLGIARRTHLPALQQALATQS